MAKKPDLILWGMIASPYLLKMQALADYSSLSWQRWPDEASSLQGLDAFLKLRRGRREHSIERYPARVHGMDEYPAVPYYSLDGRRYYYDSTGLALHLEELRACKEPLVPEEAQLHFICQLLDEAFDEFGLYMVHHNRWVTSAATNIMGKMTAAEMHPRDGVRVPMPRFPRLVKSEPAASSPCLRTELMLTPVNREPSPMYWGAFTACPTW